MKKYSRLLLQALCALFFWTHFIPLAQAVSVKPFAPFSEEGNPPEEYFFDEIFPLFQYIPPASLQIYENENRSRVYEDVMVCPGAGSDRRDYDCDNAKTETSGCDGGEVDLCFENGGKSHTVTSKNGNCKYKKPPNLWAEGEYVEGVCEYTQRPKINRNIKGTDFAVNETLVYPKLQSESLAYTNIGIPENPITYGSMQLSLDQGQRYINQLIVITRAKQTKVTLTETGEWPLGWVDWGYITPNGKTLLEIHDAMPGSILGAGKVIVEADDDFFLTGGNIDIVSDVSRQNQLVVEEVSKAAALSPQPEWVVDFLQSPMYPPSFRQGYFRPSICVFDHCCPGVAPRCPIEPIGVKRGLYYDISISQAYSAAMDNLFLTTSMNEGLKEFKNIVTKNPLARYLMSASVKATPSQINANLPNQMDGNCLKFIPWSNWLSFGVHIDYLKPDSFLDPKKECPDYHIMRDLTKETAAARSSSPLEALLDLLWGTPKVDEVSSIKKHLITIPDAMGQSIKEIQQPVYDTKDSLQELTDIKEYNESLSNIVDDGGSYLFSGKPPINNKRYVGIYSCTDPMFSAQKLTSIEAYALGTRIGCDVEEEVPEGKCDGQLFTKLLETGKYQTSSSKGEEYFTSYVKGNLTPELMNTYAAAEKETGVPCEILAGIHFVEAANNPEGSLVSGRRIGTPEPDAGGRVFSSLLETAKYAGEHLKGKVGGNIDDVETAITALSRYNGGGNSNCQLGYPYPIPYGGCPRAFEGEDDPYPTSFIDSKHDSMYLLYCADHTACAPQIFERPGSFTIALNVYNSITKSGYENVELPQEQENPAPDPTTLPSGESSSSGFFPTSCGSESLSTALGCLPFTRDAFVSALLTFIAGISGGVALTIMLAASVQIMTAAGDAKKLQAGRELFTSAVVGLLFLIFAVSILRLIAGDIIKLPGFM